MKLILQGSKSEACMHACVAMLGGANLERVIEMAGHERRLGMLQAQELLGRLGVKVEQWGYLTEAFGAMSMVALMAKHQTLLCFVYSCVDPLYAHAVVVHSGQCYDPYGGMNPAWTWGRYIAAVHAVTLKDGRFL